MLPSPSLHGYSHPSSSAPVLGRVREQFGACHPPSLPLFLLFLLVLISLANSLVPVHHPPASFAAACSLVPPPLLKSLTSQESESRLA